MPLPQEIVKKKPPYIVVSGMWIFYFVAKPIRCNKKRIETIFCLIYFLCHFHEAVNYCVRLYIIIYPMKGSK